MNLITIKEKFEKFGYYQPQNVLINNAKIQQEIHFTGDSCQTIAINDQFDNRICFGITNDIFNTQILALDDFGKFNTTELISLSNIFDFELEFFPYSNEYKRAKVHNYSPLYLASQWCQGKFYCLIYGSKGTTNFAYDILYIHGIWEVELSEVIKKKIFGENI